MDERGLTIYDGIKLGIGMFIANIIIVIAIVCLIKIFPMINFIIKDIANTFGYNFY